MAKRTICGKLAELIGSEDIAQSEYEEFADDLRQEMDSGRVPKSKSVIDIIHEIVSEERTHRKELRQANAIIGCIAENLPDYPIR